MDSKPSDPTILSRLDLLEAKVEQLDNRASRAEEREGYLIGRLEQLLGTSVTPPPVATEPTRLVSVPSARR